MKTNLQKSKGGPVTGADSGSTDEFVLYEVVRGDDDDDTNAPNLNNGTVPAVNSQSIGMKVVWGIVIALLILGIWYIFSSGANNAELGTGISRSRGVSSSSSSTT